MERIFISHASADAYIIQRLIDDILVGALAVKISDIFCTTTDGTKIKSGRDWRNAIRDHLINAKITFIIITPNYKESEVCLNEMGAAWVSSANVIPLILDPINYDTVGIIQQPKQIEKLLDEASLDRIKDVVQDELSIPPKEIKSDRWSAKKKEFLLKVKKHIAENPFHLPLDRVAFNKLQKENAELSKDIAVIVEEKAKLEKLCSDLKKIKDREQIKAVEKKHGMANEFEEFHRLCVEVHKSLSKFDSIVIGIIFKSYTGKEIVIQWEGRDQELSNAISRDYITDDFEVKWTATSAMQEVRRVLGNVQKFIEKHESKESFVNAYDEEYDAPLDVRNLDFWEQVFQVHVQFG